MARVKTFTNGGSLLPSDLNSIEDDYEYAFGTYKEVHNVSCRLDAAAAGTFLIVGGTTGTGVAVTAATAGLAPVWLDPARFLANTRTNYLNLEALAITNAIAPGCNFTFGLYPVSGSAGGAATVQVTLGAVTTGSTVAINTPALDSTSNGVSGDFAFPAVGAYVLAVVVSSNMAVSSSIALRARLSVRQV